MKIDRDGFLSQGLRMGDRRIWTDEDRLARDGSSEIDDTPTDGGVVRAPDLTPFAGVEGCRGLFFKRGMPPKGIHLHRIRFRRAVRGPLSSPEKLRGGFSMALRTLSEEREDTKGRDEG